MIWGALRLSYEMPIYCLFDMQNVDTVLVFDSHSKG
jgi:hypothetical protein